MAKSKQRRPVEPPRGVRKKAKAKTALGAGTSAVAPASGALFAAGDMVLLVGEGDLSFACALLQKFQDSVYIVATVLDTMKALTSKYPGAKANVKRLKAAGMQVRCGVDCRRLHTVDDFRGAFTKIVFNFPHLGGDGESIIEHQQLLRDFFSSAAACLEPLPRAEVHVALKAGEPYRSWMVTQMAKLGGLRFDRTVPFNALRYPGYAHCRTRGAAYAEARGLSDVNAVEGAKTYVFGLRE